MPLHSSVAVMRSGSGWSGLPNLAARAGMTSTWAILHSKENGQGVTDSGNSLSPKIDARCKGQAGSTLLLAEGRLKR